MRMSIENTTGETIRLPKPIEGEVEDGQTVEKDDLPESGFMLSRLIHYGWTVKKVAGITVRYFKGDPEEEYEVVRVGPLPGLRKKAA